MLKTESLKNGIPLSLRQKEVSPAALNTFINALAKVLGKDYKSAKEEQAKNYLNEFFSSLNYKTELNIGCDIGGGIDLAILNQDSDKVSVIVETKIHDSDEMIADDNFNKKSFHEAIRYYFYQRIVENNIETKRVIITDYNNWYVFDAADFYIQFIKNPAFKSDYIKWRRGQLDGKTAEVFYKDVAKKHLAAEEFVMSCIKFSLEDFRFITKGYDALSLLEIKNLTNLYYLFSPDFLLKEFKESDNNKLNDNFYKELLHILV